LIDHLVVTAPSLAAGADYVEHLLGVAPQAGGEHVRMGTHNRLLKLGPALYLEIISINPDAPPPGRPRWFGLDSAGPEPRLATWVGKTADIRAAPAALGKVEAMARGPYAWQLTIPADGRMPFDGVAPALIQWNSVHPAERLAERGCSLLKLELRHPRAAEIRSLFKAHPFAVEPGETTLVAHVQTPSGARKLR